MGAPNESPFIIVGLGNPGPKYALTRHNLGFLVVDFLADRWKAPTFQDKFKAQIAQTDVEGRRVILVKPLTFMNLSGDSVIQVTQFYKIPLQTHLLVVSDDLDLPVANVRIRTKGGAGGHNGLKSVIEQLGTEEFPRLRIGIGRSPHIDSADYALSRIPKAEETQYQDVLYDAAEAIEMLLKDGILKSMNVFNKKSSEPKEQK